MLVLGIWWLWLAFINFVVLLGLIFFVCNIWMEIVEFNLSKLRYEYKYDSAKVVKKEYVPGHYEIEVHFTYGIQRRYIADKHNITILYHKKEYCFSDEKIYRRIIVNDIVKVKVLEGYNKKGKVKYRHIEQIENS